jgi:hypothetical protein
VDDFVEGMLVRPLLPSARFKTEDRKAQTRKSGCHHKTGGPPADHRHIGLEFSMGRVGQILNQARTPSFGIGKERKWLATSFRSPRLDELPEALWQYAAPKGLLERRATEVGSSPRDVFDL